MDNAIIEEGLNIRRRMFGQAVTDQANSANAFNKPLQDMISQYCFGEVWTRPDLNPAARSMITIAILTALGRGPEIRTHVKGALSNGVTPKQIQEVLLHAMIYAGVPLAVDAFRNASEALKESGVDLNAV